MDFGSWEGCAWACVPRAELDAWAHDLWEYRPGGGESASMIAHRWERWLERARGVGSATIIAVTHAGFIRVALARAGQSSPEEFARGTIAFGSVHRIEVGERATVSEPAP
jgi:alpha-ribazole phosphatase